jgi:hypothetical protein
MHTRPKYNVVISPVKDVILRGSADASFWVERLAPEELAPLEVDGKAQLILIAVDARFLGIRFRELSIAVSVQSPGGDGDENAVYLPHAFQSLRLFAFIERTFYHTPYHAAKIRVETGPPASFEVALREGTIVRAAMSSQSTAQTTRPARTVEEVSEGPIFLPSRAGQTSRKAFFARLEGRADIYPFAPGDSLRLAPTARAPIVEWLIESGFAPQEWLIRTSAVHGRSKSVDRRSVGLVATAESG